MSEERGETIEPPPHPVCCGNCGEEIGRRVVIGGVVLLDTGKTLARAHHGACKTCGAEFHWQMSDAMLSRLIVHVIELRDKIYE